jgi:hypothetical protein
VKGNQARRRWNKRPGQAFQKYNKKPAIPGFRPKQTVTIDHSSEFGPVSN